jgi:hypothetical protein
MMVMLLWWRRKNAPRYEPTQAQPIWPGAFLFTLRSVPRHHDGIKAAIESTGRARAWFSEPLAYLRGQGVALLRIEARDGSFLEPLYRFWAQTEALEAFTFDISLYLNDRDFITSLREKTPEEVWRLITESAPRVPAEPADATRTPRSTRV